MTKEVGRIAKLISSTSVDIPLVTMKINLSGLCLGRMPVVIKASKMRIKS